MSVGYVIFCDADSCRATAPPALFLGPYRRRIWRDGWRSVGRRAPNGSDYCPEHAHLVADDPERHGA
jgi:hypothetical protein